MSEKYVLYGGEFTRAGLVEMVMSEAGIDYELRAVDIFKGEHQSAEFLSINPLGRVPVLITPEGERLNQTQAINLYLIERHAVANLAPSWMEPGRGEFLAGLMWIASELEPLIKQYFYAPRFVVGFGSVNATRALFLEKILEQLQLLERQLDSAGPYYLGKRFSLLDVCLAYWVTYTNRNNRYREFTSLCRLVSKVRLRPGLSAHFAKLDDYRERYYSYQRVDETG